MSAARGSRSRRLGAPTPVRVRSGPGTRPVALGGAPVESILEEWLVEDRWWTGRALSRRYFELVLADGRDAVVFLDLIAGRWYSQRA